MTVRFLRLDLVTIGLATCISGALFYVSFGFADETARRGFLARQADQFVESIGINVHLHYTGTPYVNDYQMIQEKLVSLGVRHIRDGLIDTKWQGYYDHLNALGSRGIKADLITKIARVHVY